MDGKGEEVRDLVRNRTRELKGMSPWDHHSHEICLHGEFKNLCTITGPQNWNGDTDLYVGAQVSFEIIKFQVSFGNELDFI